MRLIDADELKKKSYRTEFAVAVVDVEDIDNAPTITPDMATVIAYECAREQYERPQGEWIENVNTSCGKILRWRADIVEQKCNKCNRYTLRWRDTMASEFCSNCGAEMRGDKNETN